MILVDSLQHYPDCGLPYTTWCHMATDDDNLSALHVLARSIGLNRAWFQDRRGLPHYDLTPARRAQAIKLGAQAISSKELFRRCSRRPRQDSGIHASKRAANSTLLPATNGVMPMSRKTYSALFTTLLQRDTIRCLTMTDPWGTLVALGAKQIETRSWATPHRGPLAIHIAKSLPPEALACCHTVPFRQTLEAGGYSFQPERGHNAWGLPLGQIVAIIWLDEVQRITPAFQVDELERSFGLFTAGRFAWMFSQVYRLTKPLPARGSLGVWEWQPPASFWSEIQAAFDEER